MSGINSLPPGLQEYARCLKALHKIWQPHQGQIPVGRALFSEGVKRVFCQFGRRAGKTEMAAYSMIRWALTNPGSAIYFLGPEQKQVREILWEPGRIQALVPPEFLAGEPNNTMMRIRFKNGSFIKLDGSDSINSYRGLRMSFLVIDEYKDCDPLLLDVITPSLKDFDAPLLVIGTPPDAEDHYTQLAAEIRADPESRYFQMPSTGNPYLKPEVLERERLKLVARGDEDVWRREYLAEFVPGGKRAIFPMYNDKTHVAPYAAMHAEIRRTFGQWDFFVAADPGTASVFAVLLGAINRFDRRVFICDELYETNQLETSVGRVWPRVNAKLQELAPDHLRDESPIIVVDEAAASVRVELLDRFGVNSWPTRKAQNSKLDGLSLVKDLMLSKKLLLSDRCKDLSAEIRGYMLNKQGQPLKAKDHAIDALRYLLGVANYTAEEAAVPLERPPLTLGEIDDPRRGYSMEEDRWGEAEKSGELPAYLLEML